MVQFTLNKPRRRCPDWPICLGLPARRPAVAVLPLPLVITSAALPVPPYPVPVPGKLADVAAAAPSVRPSI
jgi:hypothetical protein